MNAQLPRVFRWFWAGETVSGFGSWITLLALQVIVVDYLHVGTVGLGWMNAARWLPYLLFGLVLGALIDRVRSRPVMIASDLVRAPIALMIPRVRACATSPYGLMCGSPLRPTSPPSPPTISSTTSASTPSVSA